MQSLPVHLQKYIVEQDYEKYTALDHAVWRYVLRQLKNFLSTNAHESYLKGLEQTGIDIDKIPRIENISQRLEKFGWRALPVSGFIPPAAFMELQSLSILPIASDMRSLDHLLYTPAPDIVHEAAGHAPIIADPRYAQYLKQYAQVAKKAILSHEDLEVYEAIRDLSDIKENPGSTPEQIAGAEERLKKVSEAQSYISEATELSRMNWWTAEYGLIGDIQKPKIFGAGILSSVHEAQLCLSDQVKKIPLSLACIRQGYDITETQPQLFVARDFEHLSQVLEELAATMAFRTGGNQGLEKALQSKSINTVELNTGLQISGVLKSFIPGVYLQFTGPAQLSLNNQEIPGHGTAYHAQGYGTPIGKNDLDLNRTNLSDTVTVTYESGVKITGRLSQATDLILSFENATCEYQDQKLFLPEWGTFDVARGETVTSVFGGPADRLAFGEVDDFVASRIPRPVYTAEQKKLFSYYQQVRDLREHQTGNLTDIFNNLRENAPKQWLLFVELAELAEPNSRLYKDILVHLATLEQKSLINEGLRLAHAEL